MYFNFNNYKIINSPRLFQNKFYFFSNILFVNESQNFNFDNLNKSNSFLLVKGLNFFFSFLK